MRGTRHLFRRGRLAGMALMCLLGQTDALVHGILIEHARCPKHGESVHVDAHASATYARVASESTALVRNAADATAEEHGHEHCLAFCERRAATVAPEAGSVVHASFAADAHVAPVEIPRPAALPLFLLAPKNSPPV